MRISILDHLIKLLVSIIVTIMFQFMCLLEVLENNQFMDILFDQKQMKVGYIFAVTGLK